MQVKIFFGSAIAHLNGKDMQLTLPEGATVADVYDYLQHERPLLFSRLVAAQTFVNGVRALPTLPLSDGAEIWFISHFIGG